MADAVVGIIGMGDMGKMYARRISQAGWRYASLLDQATAPPPALMVRWPYIHHLQPFFLQ